LYKLQDCLILRIFQGGPSHFPKEIMANKNGPGSWLVAPPNQRADLKLFCFPPAGSGAAVYRLWPALLAPKVAVYRIQPPGRENRFREDRCTDMDQYLEQVLAAIRPLLDGPFALFGHSMGSLMAFCLARRLRRDGNRLPEHLMVSAYRSPQAPPMKVIHELPDAEFIHELRHTYNGIPDQLLHEPEVLSIMLPIVRADLAVAASRRYAEETPLECPISAFGGLDDRYVDERQLAEWGAQTSGAFSLHMFPGDHFYISTATEALIRSVRSVLGAPPD
jgi:medium-chain acyl-[acyl-carrier-protein] hydrolase